MRSSAPPPTRGSGGPRRRSQRLSDAAACGDRLARHFPNGPAVVARLRQPVPCQCPQPVQPSQRDAAALAASSDDVAVLMHCSMREPIWAGAVLGGELRLPDASGFETGGRQKARGTSAATD
jgi:hypothetical protein